MSLADFRAASHPYWKVPDEPIEGGELDGWSGPPQEELSAAEVNTHQAIYGLEASVGVLAWSLESLGVQNVNDTQPDPSQVRRAKALASALYRSIFPLYLTLVANVKSTPGDHVGWFLAQLDLDGGTEEERRVREDFKEWLDNIDYSPDRQANVAIDLIERLAQPMLEEAIGELTGVVYRLAAVNSRMSDGQGSFQGTAIAGAPFSER